MGAYHVIDPPAPAMRRCLRCGRDFDSWGPGNRCCKTCRRVGRWRHDEVVLTNPPTRAEREALIRALPLVALPT